MKKILILVLLFLSFFSHSQNEPCATDQLLQSIIIDNPEIQNKMDALNQRILESENSYSRSLENPLTIPVIIYIIHNGETLGTGTNISDNQCQSQLNALNSAFYPSGIKFCLATRAGVNSTSIPAPTGSIQSTPGIIHINNSFASTHQYTTAGQQSLMNVTNVTNSSTLLNSENFLKIYIVKSINNTSSGILGYATFPLSLFDGIVMRYDAFGDINSCNGCNLISSNNQGKVLVHEVGHYLGLYHTFQGGCTGASSTTCNTQGDRVCDTPQVNPKNSGCPSTTTNSCTDTPIDLPDAINNFMDYTNDECRNEFSIGQTQRMLSELNLFRNDLFSTKNLIYAGVCGYQNLVSAYFTPNTYQTCTNISVTFTPFQPSIPNATYIWNFGDGTQISNSQASVNHIFTTQNSSPYTVTLTITTSTGIFTYNTKVYVKTCSPILNSESNWEFSTSNGLKFGTGVPVKDTSIPVTNNFDISCATQSDINGNLLFYTNGVSAWRSNHTLINSTPLLGDKSGKSIIIPIPNTTNYYIFTKPSGIITGSGNTYYLNGFRRSTVIVNGTTISMPASSINIPITLTSGMPNFLSGNNSALIGNTDISAYPKCDGYWILTVLHTSTTKKLSVFSLTSSATNPLTYISSIDLPNQSTSVGLTDDIIISPDGNKVVFMMNTISNDVLMYDFDKISGTLSNQKTIFSSYQTHYHGGSFSPDSNLFYLSNYWNGTYQININSLNPNLNKKLISKSFLGRRFKLGPDDKIYILKDNSYQLGVIHYPNNLNSEFYPNNCEFSTNGPLLERISSNSSFSSLPKTIKKLPLNNSISKYLTTCKTFKFFPNIDQSLCLSNFSWNFDDPNSGINNTSVLNNPEHFFNVPGTYNISLYSNGILIATTSLTIGLPPIIEIIGSSSACIDENPQTNNSVILSNEQSVIWSVVGGIISGPNNLSSVDVNWTTLPGQLTATVTNSNGCTSVSTKTITSVCCQECLDSLYWVSMSVPNSGGLYKRCVLPSNPNPSCEGLAMQYTWKVRSSNVTTISNCSNYYAQSQLPIGVKVDILDSGNNVLCSTNFGQGFARNSNSSNTNLLDKNISVSPNPSNGLYSIKINDFEGNINISVFDINGRLIFNEKNINFNQERTIDLSIINSGVYLLKIENESINHSQKLIKN